MRACQRTHHERRSGQARIVTEEPPNQRPENGGLKRGPEAPHRRYFWLLACAWTAAVAGSLAWNLAQHEDEVRSLTVESARALLEKDLLYREWSILHGGVYVPKSAPPEGDAAAQD